AFPLEGDIRPHEGETCPHEGAARPHEGAARPHEGEARPLEGEARPLEGEARPLEGEARPHEGAAQPHEGEARPHEGEAAPHGGGNCSPPQPPLNAPRGFSRLTTSPALRARLMRARSRPSEVRYSSRSRYMSQPAQVGLSSAVPKLARIRRMRSLRQISSRSPDITLPIPRSATASMAATQLHAMTVPSGRTMGPL